MFVAAMAKLEVHCLDRGAQNSETGAWHLTVGWRQIGSVRQI